MKTHLNFSKSLLRMFQRKIMLTTAALCTLFLLLYMKADARNETLELYHAHSGSIQEGTGCYTRPLLCGGTFVSQSEPVYCGKPGSTVSESTWICQAGHADIMSFAGGWYVYPHNAGCSHVTGYRTYYQCSLCGKKYDQNADSCTCITGYEPACECNEGSAAAVVTITGNSAAWTKQLELQVNLTQLQEACCLSDLTVSLTGCEGETLSMSGAGTLNYAPGRNGTVTVQVNGNSWCSGGSLAVEVSTLDRLTPSILQVSLDKQNQNTACLAEVLAVDGESGLADMAYSWNKGLEYGSESTHLFSENGTYEVWVRDRVGNVSQYSFQVQGIVNPTASADTGKQNTDKPAASTNTMVQSTTDSETKPCIDSVQESEEAEAKESIKAAKPDNTSVTLSGKVTQKESELIPLIIQDTRIPLEQVPGEAGLKGTNQDTALGAVVQQNVEKQDLNEDTQSAEKDSKTQSNYNLVVLFFCVTAGVSGLVIFILFLYRKAGCLLHNGKKSAKIQDEYFTSMNYE